MLEDNVLNEQAAEQAPDTAPVAAGNDSKPEAVVAMAAEPVVDVGPVATHSESQPAAIVAAVTEPVADAAPVSEEEQARKQHEAQLLGVMGHILDDEQADWGEMLKTASLHEMALLMEELARRPMERGNIRRVGQLKKQFDETLAQQLGELNQSEDEAAKHNKQHSLENSGRMSKALIAFNKRRVEFENGQAKEKEENLKIKRHLLEQLKVIVMAEEVSALDKVRHIQNQWRATGQVPQAELDDLMQSYKAYLDQFYGLRAKYNELLEQDRKVNQEEKEKLIHEIETLAANQDRLQDPTFWQAAGERVKELHENWKHIGPVAREANESLWQRFKAATDAFYNLRRTYFEARDEERGKNTELKKEIVGQMLPYAEFASESRDAWMKANDELVRLQKEWNETGPILQSERALIKQFRDILNGFYKRRSAYFATLNQARTGLVDAKEKLLAQAEALAADAEMDQHKKADQFKALQRAWKETGQDDYKDARKLQKRFRKICDVFFGQVKEQMAGRMKEEEENLAQKEAILVELEAMAANANGADNSRIQALQQQWDGIGHVPLKQKDKVIGRYRKAMQTLGRGGRGPVATQHQERRTHGRMRQLEEIIAQYENNILFISKNKSGDALRAEINQKIEAARAEMQQIVAAQKAEEKAARAAARAAEEATQPTATTESGS